MLIQSIEASKLVSGTISDNITQNHYFMHIFGVFWPNALRNSIAMATPKIPGDQKLFEMVYCMLKLKVTKFQLPRPDGF